MRVVPLEAFRDKIPFSVAIAAVERGFRALGRGEAALPDPMVLELREQQAEVHVKGAHLAGGRHIVLKVATGFYRNRARGLPSGDGMFLLLDADTGVPAVLLEEHGYLTDFRTAAAVALTLKYLAPKDTHEALLVGAGALARLTARAMLAQMPLARLTLWNRTRERAEGLAKELGQAVETRIAPALESAVRDHRVIAHGGLERRGDARLNRLTELFREPFGTLAGAIPQGEPRERHLREHGPGGETGERAGAHQQGLVRVLGRQILEGQGHRRRRAEVGEVAVLLEQHGGDAGVCVEQQKHAVARGQAARAVAIEPRRHFEDDVASAREVRAFHVHLGLLLAQLEHHRVREG